MDLIKKLRSIRKIRKRCKLIIGAKSNRGEKRAIIGDSVIVTNYLRDAGGNVMSIYSDTAATEIPIYGSSRLWQYKRGIMEGHRTLGHRTYELSNHLGNVLAVITDNAGMKQDSVWSKVTNISDYYPFGLEVKGRSLNVATEEVTEGECLECADLKTQLDAYVTANGAPALSNRTALTDFLNNELNRSTTQAEYESSFKQCELVNTYTSFTGGNYVDFGKQPQYELGTSDFTIEAWIRMPTNFGYDCYPIVTNQNHFPDGSYNGIHFAICSRKLGFSVSEGAPGVDAVTFTNDYFPNDAQWHHVVIERIGNRVADFKVYIDDVPQASDGQGDALVSGNMSYKEAYDKKDDFGKYNNVMKINASAILRAESGDSDDPTRGATNWGGGSKNYNYYVKRLGESNVITIKENGGQHNFFNLNTGTLNSLPKKEEAWRPPFLFPDVTKEKDQSDSFILPFLKPVKSN